MKSWLKEPMTTLFGATESDLKARGSQIYDDARATEPYLVARAFGAYYIWAARYVDYRRYDHPALGCSGLVRHKDRSYIVLRNRDGILAVYRVRNGKKLKSTKRAKQ